MVETTAMPKSKAPRKRAPNKRRAIVLATPGGKIQFADVTARRWLKQFFGRSDAAGFLPRKLCRWLKAQTRPGKRSSAVARHQNTRLFIKKEKASTEQSTLLFLELMNGKSEERSRCHRALTPRERDVLLWLTRGKSNSEIAEILGIRRATVSKHLERIYPKLGVENRAAAISVSSE